MEAENKTKAKKFIEKVIEHLNPVIKTDEDFTKYATSQWMKLLASKSSLCSSDLDKLEELIKCVIQSSMEWKENQLTDKVYDILTKTQPRQVLPLTTIERIVEQLKGE